jgi:predicted nucleic acid-binding protein
LVTEVSRGLGERTKNVLIDTNILDYIHDDTKFERDLRTLVQKGEIAPLITHVQRDEVKAMGKDKAGRREALLRLIDELMGIVTTKGAAFDVPRFNMSSFDDSGNLDSLRTNNGEPNSTRDALIFYTATEGDIDLFVSNDEDRLKRLIDLDGAPPVARCDGFKIFVRTLGIE